jgi:hypothetical protein
MSLVCFNADSVHVDLFHLELYYCELTLPHTISRQTPLVCCQLVCIAEYWVHFIPMLINDIAVKCHQSASVQTLYMRTNFTMDSTIAD